MNVNPTQVLHAVNASKGGTTIAQNILWAGSSRERRRGLLDHNSLSATAGIYLVPCEWVHTFGMKFPIDVAFLSAEGRVLAMHHGLKPNRLSKIVLRAEGVLELAEGTLRASNTEVGDVVQFLNIAMIE